MTGAPSDGRTKSSRTSSPGPSSFPNPVVRIRAADAVEKVSRTRADLVAPHKALLFGRFASPPDKEVRWHVAQILPRIVSTDADKTRACTVLLAYLVDDSSIVKTCAMQGLADLARVDAKLRGKVLPRLKELTRLGTPAMRARGRKLLAELDEA